MITHLSDQDWKEGEKSRAMNLLFDQTDRKITRNQKRKHCEIHLLQKASILFSSMTGMHGCINIVIDDYLILKLMEALCVISRNLQL
jgi:hypothetical protein